MRAGRKNRPSGFKNELLKSAGRLRESAALSFFILSSLFFACTFNSGFPEVSARPCVNCPQNQPGLDPYSNGSDSYNPVHGLGRSSQGSSLLQGGTGSTTLQLGAESTLLQGGAKGALLQASVEREGAPVNILFLIDCSQSMKEKISAGAESDSGKEPKMEAAKRVLQETLSRIPNDINLGLRVFGNGFRNDPSDCQQSTLLVSIGRDNRRSIIEAVRGIAPYGLTPLTFALMKAEEDLRYCQGPKTVILLSDGAETCGGDPCAYIDRLSRLGIKMKVDVLGLGLRRDHQAQDQLNCIAQKSGGKYYDVNTSADLVNSITNSVKQAVSGRVITKVTNPLLDTKSPADLAVPKFK